MKRGTPDHWKMRELAKLLGLPTRFGIATANGIMERLWHYTAKFHPRGDIGASPDWAIADACGWSCDVRSGRTGQDSGKLVAFIDALVTARWLDRDNECRLLVHDWPDHADTSVKKHLKDKGLEFCSRTLPKGPVLLPSPSPSPSPSQSRWPPETGARAPAAGVIPPDAETRIRALAEQFPNPQDFEEGIAKAFQEIQSSANPEVTLRTLEENLPVWAQAMRENWPGVRIKPMRWVIVDRDYIRRPRDPTQGTKSKSDTVRAQIIQNENPRLKHVTKSAGV